MTDYELHRQIVEWQPLTVDFVNGLFIGVFLLAVAASRWHWNFALPSLLLLGSVLSQRQFPLFAVAALGVVAEGYERFVAFLNVRAPWHSGQPHLDAVQGEGEDRKGDVHRCTLTADRSFQRRNAPNAVGLLWRQYLLAGVATVLAAAVVHTSLTTPHNDWPVRGAADLRSEACAGNVFNEYDFGGYLIWQVPGTKVYIDGRMPSWRQDGTYYLANWRRVLDDADFARSEFARYDIGCAVLEKQHGRLVEQLKSEGWRVTADDTVAVTLRRP
jgi:hypothetical protein